MRIGQNPVKFVQEVAQPARVTVAVVNYIPTLGGYYAESLEVLKVCLNSIWQNTGLPYDLLVFDNASCEPVREYLSSARDEGRIQYLVLSEKNIGKAGAWNFIFGAAPGEIVAYADNDVYHYPGWLSAQVAVLGKFLKIGMVTGMPMWSPVENSTATVQWAEGSPNVGLERGKFLSWEDYRRHGLSLGAEEDYLRQRYDEIEDIVLISGDERYFVGAAHFQFIAYRDVLRKMLPIPSERAMGQVRLLDQAINEQGYLRLCTPDWWVMHMGNTLAGMADQFSVTESTSRPDRRISRFWQIRPIRRIVQMVYHRSFEILYKG
jgi:glycosyltransferase involved in cell wall biosynthesis